MLCICIAIIIDIIAWDLCITMLEALIFISLHALIWADYTINIYPEIRDGNESQKNNHPQIPGADILVCTEIEIGRTMVRSFN